MDKFENREYRVSALELALLVFHLFRAAEHPEVGFEDTDRTFFEMRGTLNKQVRLPKAVLESALWSSNLLSELGLFWHPDKKTFAEFAQGIVGREGDSFDLFYNWVKEGKK
jgi:hypothetical protein